MNITPKKGENGTDWLAYLRTTWPVVVTMVGATIWMTNYVEGPKERALRQEGYLKAFDRLEKTSESVTQKIDAHTQSQGHPITIQRLDGLSGRLDELRVDTKQILEKVNKQP